MTTVSIVGASGYTGGELLRWLYLHPHATIQQVTSRQYASKPVHQVHPNFRQVLDLRFIHPDELAPCDVLFLAMPHGEASLHIEHYANLATHIIDLSADFRLQDAETYARWYGDAHASPDWLTRFVYGLPEVNRDALRQTRYASGVGCNATAVNLALMPLARAGVIEHVTAELKVGSSEAGHTHNASSHHPVRSGAVRTYSAMGHRHQAETQMILGDVHLRFSVTAIEMIRGVQLVAHVDLHEAHTTRDIWGIYRQAYNDEPFVRLVNGKTGNHRLPEPRVVAGTNYTDIGFTLSDDGRYLVVVAALDNLGKGAASNAIQCMNLMLGWDECAGLAFPGMYP
jgi:N-acetyl-gamma-glutamyl-phosphate/LysW-gamma-L-alpha-aminoadipyl-6-phosphate reductase